MKSNVGPPASVYLTNPLCFVGKAIVAFHKPKGKLINFKPGDHGGRATQVVDGAQVDR